uniref:Uncharacterized protein n=1 Tax=Setaria viridis TaxID=4556 RepID=A0A4U6UNB6_SETVI|nr:hypothetical protein SEVIR_5G402801v2 [Setaria viridis]
MARKTFRPHPGEATTRRRGTSSTATGSRPASTLSVAFSPSKKTCLLHCGVGFSG